MTLKLYKIAVSMVIASSIFTSAHANNLSITNVSLGSRDPGTKSLVIKFNVGWNNSWHNKINHDAVWLTIRLNNTQDTVTNKILCQVSASGINPSGSSVGTASSLEFYVPTDKVGAFLRRGTNGNVANIATENAQLTIDYSSCGFSDSDQIYASVNGLEMVYVPEGSFYAGDFNTSNSSLNQGSSDSNPWHIISENAIPVSNPSANGYRYVSNSNAGEFATGATFSIPATFPKGYESFYVMKYEINEGQWVEFVNSIGSAAARANRDITDNNHKNSDAVIARNTISCSGNPLSCITERPARPVSYLSWMDLAAFLSWNGLRPITELEFEKIARGPLLPVNGEFSWGSGYISAASTISGDEDGSETILDPGANANYGSTTFNGGDSSQSIQHRTGSLRMGILASSGTTRQEAGASYYGVMDFSGNLKEHVVTIGNSSGLIFDGQHGDGSVTSSAGFEGNANVLNWPGYDVAPGRGITTATGSGFRGGSWADTSDYLRISDRSEAALTAADAINTYGGRGARTYDGN